MLRGHTCMLEAAAYPRSSELKVMTFGCTLRCSMLRKTASACSMSPRRTQPSSSVVSVTCVAQ